MPEARLTATENGPYEVKGAVELLDQDGRPIRAREGRLLLCRCGESADKPFCDRASEGSPPRCARLDGSLAV